jgi:hypothetical protein
MSAAAAAGKRRIAQEADGDKAKVGKHAASSSSSAHAFGHIESALVNSAETGAPRAADGAASAVVPRHAAVQNQAPITCESIHYHHTVCVSFPCPDFKVRGRPVAHVHALQPNICCRR